MGVGSGQESGQAAEKVERIQDQLGGSALLGPRAAELVEDASIGVEGKLKLLKIGALVSVSVRRVRFRLASGYPYADLFREVLYNLRHGLSPG